MSIFAPPRKLELRVIPNARPTKGRRVRVKAGLHAGYETNVVWYAWDKKRGPAPTWRDETNGIDGYLVGLPGVGKLIVVDAANVDVFEDPPSKNYRSRF
jgi:hypothetical protein